MIALVNEMANRLGIDPFDIPPSDTLAPGNTQSLLSALGLSPGSPQSFLTSFDFWQAAQGPAAHQLTYDEMGNVQASYGQRRRQAAKQTFDDALAYQQRQASKTEEVARGEDWQRQHYPFGPGGGFYPDGLTWKVPAGLSFEDVAYIDQSVRQRQGEDAQKVADAALAQQQRQAAKQAEIVREAEWFAKHYPFGPDGGFYPDGAPRQARRVRRARVVPQQRTARVRING